MVFFVFPCVGFWVFVEEDSTKEYGAGFVEVAWALRGELLVFPELFAGYVAGCTGCVDVVCVFGADVVVEEVGQEVSDCDGGQADHFFGVWVEVVGEVGCSGLSAQGTLIDGRNTHK